MKTYRIENAHFVEFFDRYEGNKTQRQYVNIWCADDDSFNAITSMIYDQGAHYIRAYHNAKTDGHGNAWNGEKWVVPAHFYKAHAEIPHKMDSFCEGNPATTKSGQNRTWLVLKTVEFVGNGKIWSAQCFLKRDGRHHATTTNYIHNASMKTEASARSYIKSHENQDLKMVSLIDYLASF